MSGGSGEEKKKVQVAERAGPKPKDAWDIVDIFFKPLGGLFTGLALAIVGYFTTQLLESQQAENTARLAKQQAEETNRRLYTEIMTSREKADSDLRKEMFNTIIRTFLTPKDASLSEHVSLAERVVAVELLAYNFHDVIDLSPLFKHVDAAVSASSLDAKEKDKLIARLERAAAEVVQKQLAALGEAGVLIEETISFDKIEEESGAEIVFDTFPAQANSLGGSDRRYILVEVLGLDTDNREALIHLESGDPEDLNISDADAKADVEAVFSVGFFDFPMIDNTRLSHSQRIAVALTRWSESARQAKVAMVYFPGSRASLKEKQYYDELIEHLSATRNILLKRETDQ